MVITQNRRIKNILFFVSLLLLFGNKGYSQDSSQFRKIRLNELFDLADQNSNAIQSALAEKSVADYKIKVAKSAKLPDISLGIDAAYLADIYVLGLNSGMESGTYDMPNFYNDYGIEAAWVLYAGGNIKRGIDMAFFEQKISEAAIEGTRSGVRLMLAGLFTDLYVAQNQQEVLKKNIEQTNLLLQNMASRLKAGVILESDYIRYELQLSNLNFALSKINNHINKVSVNISETLGLPVNETLVASINESGTQTATADSNDVSNNPEVKISALQEEIAEKNIAINRSNLKPSVTLFATSNFTRPFIYDIPAIDIYSDVSLVGVNISFNISNLYKNKNHVEMAKVQLIQSQHNKQLTEEKQRIALHDAIVDHQQAIEQLVVAQKELELASKNYSLIVNQYKNELALITDVMDASNTKLNAELQLENAKAGILFAYYKTQHITGDL